MSNCGIHLRLGGTVLELETCLIDEVGTLPYSRRLEILNLTTLAEQRIRGDLIEAFKVTSGLTDYGLRMFRIMFKFRIRIRIRISRSGLNLSLTKIKNIQKSILPEQVIPYWNKFPLDENSVTDLRFKIKLEGFKKDMISKSIVQMIAFFGMCFCI